MGVVISNSCSEIKANRPVTLQLKAGNFYNDNRIPPIKFPSNISFSTPAPFIPNQISRNNGNTWQKIFNIVGSNPETFSWTVPDVSKTKSKCKVKITLKNDNGKTLGIDTADSYFTIQPD
jgi:hypothetical protein